MNEPLPRTSGSSELDEVALVDLLDRVLAKGVVVTGDITLSIANVDLVYVSLRALVTSVRKGMVGTEEPDPEPATEIVDDTIDGAIEGEVIDG